MTSNLQETPIVFREFDLTDPNGVRCDFFMESGPLVSSYDRNLTMMISILLVGTGYKIEDFPCVQQ